MATTTTLGLLALRKGLVGDQGLVSQLPQFGPLDLLPWDALVFGGHEIRTSRLVEEARKLARVSRALDESLIEQCAGDLDEIDRAIRPGVLRNVGATIEQLADADLRQQTETPRDSIARLQADLKAFR